MSSTFTKEQDVLEILRQKAKQYANRFALCLKEKDQWRKLTYAELSERVGLLATYFLTLQVKSGDRIALLSESRVEWGIGFFAAICAGATVVPLDIKLTEAELEAILSNCTPKIVLTSAKHKETIAKLAQNIPSIAHIFLVEDASGDSRFSSIDRLIPQNAHPHTKRQPSDIALIVYTSGTTGSAKGVMITFANLIFEVNSFERMINLTEKDSFLSILPLNHLLELTGGFLGVLNQGGTICFCHSLFPHEVMRQMQEQGITGMVGVPLFFKSLQNSIEKMMRAQGEASLATFAETLEQVKPLSLAERRKVFSFIHEKLGNKLRVLICGGAPLDLEVATFFDRLGLPILQGYGLTETSPVISGNTLEANCLGSVGQILPGTELKIDTTNGKEGEILTRGPHVMYGYYKNDDLTKEVIDEEGWFHTGDLGYLDAAGFLHISGRMKNLIVLGGGKKVLPEEVETVLSSSASIKETCILGVTTSRGFREGTEEVCAVVVPADHMLNAYKDNPKSLKQAVKTEIDKLTKDLATYKRPTRILLYPQEFPKTVTHKIKRPALMQWATQQEEGQES